MNVNNLYPTLIIFVFLIIMFLVGIFRNKVIKKKNVSLKNLDIPISFYCYNNSSIKDLFKLTFLDLLLRGYYKLYKKNEIIYIENVKSDDSKLLSYQKRVLSYINNLIYKEDNDNKICLDTLDYNISTDVTFGFNLTKFNNEIKEDAKNIYGNIDNFSNYILSIIFGIIYYVFILYSIYNKLSITQLFVFSILLTFPTILISDKLKNKIHKFSKLRIFIFSIVSLIIAIISCLTWINFSGYNYLFFHFIMAILTFMIPLFIFLNIYLIKTNTFFFNDKQKEIVNILNNILNDLLEDDKLANKNYLLSKAFKINVKNDDELIEKFVRIIGI